MLPPIFRDDSPAVTIEIDEMGEDKNPMDYKMDMAMDMAIHEITDALHAKLDDGDKQELKKGLISLIEMCIYKKTGK